MYQILVVEDNKNTHQVICEFLKEAGYIVTDAYDGEEAITYFYEGRFDSCEATSQVRAGSHLATAARVTYPAALQRILFDAPLLAAGLLTWLFWIL